MRRSIGVTVIAVLALLGSILTLLLGVLMAWVMFNAPPANASEFPGSPIFFKAMLFIAVLMYVIPAIWGIWTSIGLFKLKNWARLSIIVFSVLLVLMSGFGGLMILIVPFPTAPNQPVDPTVMSTVRIFMGLFAASLAGLGVWWVVFFNRPRVRQQFVAGLPAPSASSPTEAPFAVQAPLVTPVPRPDQRPLSLTILACFMLVGCLFMPLGFLLHAPAMFLTTILTGWAAAAFYFVLTGLVLYIAVGLLRLWLPARVAGIWYFVFAFLNMAAFHVLPGGRARMMDLWERQQAMFPWIPRGEGQPAYPFDPVPMMVMVVVIGLVGSVVPLYFLITRKHAFEMAAAAKLRPSVS